MNTNIQIINYSVLLLSLIALVIGIFLCVSSNIFKTEVDELFIKIRECLPGNNCGGCGYAGCDQLAEAIIKKIASIDSCPVCGINVAKNISNIIGININNTNKKVAFVHCNGHCNNVIKTYEYNGPHDCNIVKMSPNNGDKKCEFACIGFGNCINVYQFDAIHIIENKIFYFFNITSFFCFYIYI